MIHQATLAETASTAMPRSAQLEKLKLRSPRSARKLAYDPEENAFVNGDSGERYSVDHGVVRMLDGDDSFYEGAYMNRVAYLPSRDALPFVLPLWLINSGYVWRVAREIPAGATIVELGGAGGVAYFGRRYTMVGVDLSASALKYCAEAYALGVQANAAQDFPFEDSSVDGIVSSYFWEHIAPADKPALLAQCVRVLKPGGKLVFLYDVTTQNPLIAYHRNRDPNRYQAEFLTNDGHIGYQTPAENAALFRAAGLTLKRHVGLERTPLLGAPVFTKLSSFPGRTKPLLSALSRLGRSRWFYPYTALTRVADETAGRLLPQAWARIVLTVAEKPRVAS
jgi:SAM-dependent methyltransferase